MPQLQVPIQSPPVTSGSAASGRLNGEDETIPTAVVNKNIPFNVKREMLLDIIVRHLYGSCAGPR